MGRQFSAFTFGAPGPDRAGEIEDPVHHNLHRLAGLDATVGQKRIVQPARGEQGPRVLRSALGSSLLLPGTSAWNVSLKLGGTCAVERGCRPPEPGRRGR